jgi:hypothetical protein
MIAIFLIFAGLSLSPSTLIGMDQTKHSSSRAPLTKSYTLSSLRGKSTLIEIPKLGTVKISNTWQSEKNLKHFFGDAFIADPKKIDWSAACHIIFSWGDFGWKARLNFQSGRRDNKKVVSYVLDPAPQELFTLLDNKYFYQWACSQKVAQKGF